MRELFAADTGSGSRHFLFCRALYPSFCVSKLYLRLVSLSPPALTEPSSETPTSPGSDIISPSTPPITIPSRVFAARVFFRHPDAEPTLSRQHQGKRWVLPHKCVNAMLGSAVPFSPVQTARLCHLGTPSGEHHHRTWVAEEEVLKEEE